MLEKMSNQYYINYLRYVYCSAELWCLNKLPILSVLGMSLFMNVQYPRIFILVFVLFIMLTYTVDDEWNFLE